MVLKIRPVYVYVKTPTTMDQLKPGDLFSMDKAVEDDTNTPSDIFLATSTAEPQAGMPEGSLEVLGHRLIQDPAFEGQFNGGDLGKAPSADEGAELG
jgi:hypothetical protein